MIHEPTGHIMAVKVNLKQVVVANSVIQKPGFYLIIVFLFTTENKSQCKLDRAKKTFNGFGCVHASDWLSVHGAFLWCIV